MTAALEDPAAGGDVVEPTDHRVDLLRDLPVEGPVVTEKAAQHLGEGKDHLPVRQLQQQPLVHVLSEQQGAFLGTGRTEVENLAAEGKYSARQLLQTGAAQSARVIDLVASGELGEVGAEQPLQRVGAPLPVGAWGCGLRLESQRVGHSKD